MDKDVVCVCVCIYIYKIDIYIIYIYAHTYIHTMEYYLAIKKNEVMPFAATWMDLEIIKLNEVSQRKTNII